MKKLVLLACTVFIGYNAKAQSYIPVPVTGFNADVVANGSGAASTSTTNDVDNLNWVFVTQNFVNGSALSPTSYLPANGTINSGVSSTPGLSFQLAPYTGNNSLRINGVGTGTLTFSTPRSADKVFVLATTGSGGSSGAKTNMIVNFSDGTNQTFTGQVVPDWTTGTTFAIAGISQANRSTDVITNDASNPRIYQFALTLDAANTAKTIQSIGFNVTTVANVNTTLNVMGVSVLAPLPIDIGVSAISSPTSPVAPAVSKPVTVTVKNYGSTPLSTATLGFSVDGTTVVNNYAFNSAASPIATNATSTPVTIGNYAFPAGTHTVKAWSTLPNGVADGNKANDTTKLNIISCTALAGTYTIDKNGTAGPTLFKSFANAAQALNSCGVSGAVTFNVAANSGPYNEQVVLGAINGVSATNTITFNGNGNTMAAITSATNPGVFTLDGSDYVKVDNFILVPDPTVTSGCGVQLKNTADNNTISNNTINLPLSVIGTAFNGIIAGATITTTGDNTNNTKILNNIINGGYYGICINGSTTAGTGAVANQIKGNQVKDFYYYGIYLNYVTNTLVEGNNLFRPARTNSSVFYGINLAGTSVNNMISKNRIHNTHDVATTKSGYVYAIYTSTAGGVGTENIIANNAIYNINNTGGTFYAFYNTGGNNTYYYYNTVSADDPAISYATLRGIYFLNPPTNVKFINNILSLTSNAPTKHAIYLGGIGNIPTSNYNDFYMGTTGNVGYYGGISKTTLADWKATNTNAFDQNSISADPLFINASTGNLKPNTVAVDNLAQPVTAITDDITGATRPAAPDMGAYEFGVTSNDVAIVDISGPSTTGCGLSATETITVTIKNYGSTTQNAVPVTFSVDGTPMAATPETSSVSIAPNATGNYTFKAKANLSTSGPHVIIAKTQLTGDAVTNNDADTLNVVNSMIAGLPMTFDFETPTTGIARFQKVVKTKSNITDGSGASNNTLGLPSTKGMIMDGVDNAGWVPSSGVNDPWTSNLENFSAVYICVNPSGGALTDSLWLTFDLKQLYKTTNANTNFRVTINGTAIGGNQTSPANIYRPPFNGTGGTTSWTKVKLSLNPYKNDPSVRIGLESSVKEAYANGNGTANLIDNIEIKRRITQPTGVKNDMLQSQLHVFPNPSNGIFTVDLPKGKAYQMEVTDLTGRVLKKQIATAGSNQLNMEGAAKGIYLLNVSGENGKAVRKLIVE